MDEGSIGRLLVASLHQSIADELPTRLDFYESWLSPEGLRDGRIGLAPLAAVLSFLRQESGGAYPRVTGRAGAYSAQWLVDAMGPTRRRVALWLPRRLRVWVVLRIAQRLVRQTYGGSRVVGRGVGLGRGIVDVRGSVFCQVRDRVPEPLCEFYASALRVLLSRFELPMDARTAECRAVGAARCTIALTAAHGQVDA
ncbi:MAG TPA: hypothetical protein VIY56_11460 [Vicinamibacterales bacterium]